MRKGKEIILVLLGVISLNAAVVTRCHASGAPKPGTQLELSKGSVLRDVSQLGYLYDEAWCRGTVVSGTDANSTVDIPCGKLGVAIPVKADRSHNSCTQGKCVVLQMVLVPIDGSLKFTQTRPAEWLTAETTGYKCNPPIGEGWYKTCRTKLDSFTTTKRLFAFCTRFARKFDSCEAISTHQVPDVGWSGVEVLASLGVPDTHHTTTDSYGTTAYWYWDHRGGTTVQVILLDGTVTSVTTGN